MIAAHDSNGAFPTSVFADLINSPELDARRLNVAADAVIYEPGSAARNLYFIHKGQVRTYQFADLEEGRLVDILGADHWFGETSLAKNATYGDKAVAVVPSIISEVSAEKFLAQINQHTSAVHEVIRQLACKLRHAREEAAGLVFDDCNQRLIKTLVRFSRSAAAAPHGDGVVLRITHEQLAQAIGVARETVSLALTQLRQRNLLRTGRNQLMFNPDVLLNATREKKRQAQEEPELTNVG